MKLYEKFLYNLLFSFLKQCKMRRLNEHIVSFYFKLLLFNVPWIAFLLSEPFLQMQLCLFLRSLHVCCDY
ncbi:hypothetical protein CICLE_v10029750mg [Citrus x clementina]|uniref:Uncharacterized protein n=1 Tax=Citrus clementina TaxID=85681 RepID=V4UDZ7_CITCL|nr:hypothetical protein CICLE_v10029750mg [Citrus x clementina]